MDDKRRLFLKQIAGRSLAAVGITAVALELMHEKSRVKSVWKYAKPQIKSFLPETTVYARATGAGTFTLKGTT